MQGRRSAQRALLAAVVSAGVLGGCSNMSGTLAQRVQQWAAAAPFGADDSTIQLDLTELAAGLRLHELKALRTECQGFSVDVSALYATLPTPDRTATDDLNTALVTWTNAAAACYSSSSFTSRPFATYRRELAQGSRAYAVAKKRLASFGVR